MTPKSLVSVSFIVCASLLGSVAVAQSAAGGERTFTTALTGSAEVPNPGDPDGSGSATVTVSVREKQVCYDFTVMDIDPIFAAHIHIGAAGTAGPPVVTLDPSGSGCEDVSANVAAQILARPSQYYVNVHNEEFPDGALRGQLG